MKPSNPKICPYCNEEDELIWDKERKEWLCSFCQESFIENDVISKYEQEEALRHAFDEYEEGNDD